MNVLPENIGMVSCSFSVCRAKRSGVFRVQADLSIKRKGAFPDGGHHIVIGVNRDTELFLREQRFLEKSCAILFGDS